MVVASRIGISIANAKLDSFDTGTINVLKVDIADMKIGVNDTDIIVNALVITIADSRLENNITNIKNALVISIIGNCLKKVERIGIYKFSTLGGLEVKKASS